MYILCRDSNVNKMSYSANMETYMLLCLSVLTTTCRFSTVSGSEQIPFIVGGVEVTQGEFPWMVDVIREGRHACGATILNADWILTAAHCTRLNVTNYIVVAGDHDNTIYEGSEQFRGIQEIVDHPEFDYGTYDNDISLMKVATPFTFNEQVQPLELSPDGFSPSLNFTVIGWGRIYEGGPISPKLLKVDLSYVDDVQCNQTYTGRISESMMCFGNGGRGDKDSCNGDSGGPLMYKIGNKTRVCALVSWGEDGCASPIFPGVYTKVFPFLDWIDSVVNL